MSFIKFYDKKIKKKNKILIIFIERIKMKLIKSVLFGGFVLTTSLIVLGSAITAVAKKDKIISKLKKIQFKKNRSASIK